MKNITAQVESLYSICGLSSEDMELICLGLDSITGIEHHRADKIELIIKAIEKTLPEVEVTDDE